MAKTSTNTPSSNKKKKNPKGTSTSTTGKKRDKDNNNNNNNNNKSHAVKTSNRTIPRNDNGGILITDEEIDRAFNFFDIDDTNQITSSNLRDRLSIFSAAPPKPNEIRFLLNSKPHLTKTELRDLIKENSSDSKNFDPYREAFSWFDPLNTGYIDLNIFKRTFSKLGFGDTMDEDELLVLLEVADKDKDGKISLLDFQNMLSSTSNLTETTTTTESVPSPAPSPTNQPNTIKIEEDDNDGAMKDNNNNNQNNQATNDETSSEL